MPDVPVRVYECYVESVNRKRKTLTAKSHARRFRSASYLFPYMSMIGNDPTQASGMEYTPSPGDQCIVLDGGPGREFVIGFQLPFSSKEDQREEMPHGSLSFRVLGEDGSDAHLILYRGGTVLIGSGKSCQTLYSPIDRSIVQLFNKWEMLGPGGHVKWSREIGTDKVTYEAEYRTRTNENSPGSQVKISIDDVAPLKLEVNTQEDPEGFPAFSLVVTNDGVVNITGNIIKLTALAGFEVTAPEVIINGRPVTKQKDPI